jgi:Co/Zn/Cd efflux system component
MASDPTHVDHPDNHQAPEHHAHGHHGHGHHGHGHHGHGHHGHGHHGHGHGSGGSARGIVASIFRPHSHDAADSIDSELEASAQGVRALKISLIALVATSLAQAVVVWFTGSVALLADTIHNVSDALTAVPLWIAFALGGRAATRRYTYGYGRAEDLAGVLIVAMITLSSLLAGYESIRRLIAPRPIENIGALLAAGLIGFAGNELVAF